MNTFNTLGAVLRLSKRFNVDLNTVKQVTTTMLEYGCPNVGGCIQVRFRKGFALIDVYQDGKAVDFSKVDIIKLKVKHFTMPDMRFTYEKDKNFYTHLSSEYLFMGEWVQFDKREHFSLCEFLDFVIESDNLTMGFSDNGYTVTEVSE